MVVVTEIRHLLEHTGEPVQVRGWVQTTRLHGKIAFVMLRDGTGILQAVVPRAEVGPEVWELIQGITQESSVLVQGVPREERRAPGGVELGVQSMEVIGTAPDFPIQPKEHGVEFLLDHRHLWLRSRTQRAVMLVRSEVEQAIHDFFYTRGFIRVDSPILTGAIGEEASGLFQTDYFGEQAYLAQTGQLYVEAAAAAFGKVYCFGPTFRAEKSKTRRHLNEFWMVEPEMAWYDSEDNMKLQEELVSYIVERVMERCRDQLQELERDTTSLERVVPPFPRLEYTEAVARLQAGGSRIEWGQDLGAADETAIGQLFDRPVFVRNYPVEAKAFYMKRNPEDERTVLCNDLLAPEGYGEIIGGSQREDDHDLLLSRIREEGLPEKAYAWYLDLRKYGTFQHSGFGLGIERTVIWICGRHHVREAIPFPRMLNRLYP